MLVEEKEEDEPRIALSPVDENTSNQVAKVSDAEKRRAALLRACVIDAQRAARAAGGPVEARDDRAFAAPSEATLKKWIRCVAWLRQVSDDAATHLGAAGARALGARKLPFHELVVRPLETLAPLLSEQSAPFLARISQVVDNLPKGAEWIACADLVAEDGVPRPRSRAEVDFYRRLDMPERAVGLQTSRCLGRRLRRAITGGAYGSGRPRPPQGGARGGEVRVALGRPGEHALQRSTRAPQLLNGRTPRRDEPPRSCSAADRYKTTTFQDRVPQDC